MLGFPAVCRTMPSPERAAPEEPFDSLGWRGDLSYDSPACVGLRQELSSSGLPGLASRFTVTPTEPGFAKRAVEIFTREGFVVVEGALNAQQTECELPPPFPPHPHTPLPTPHPCG